MKEPNPQIKSLQQDLMSFNNDYSEHYAESDKLALQEDSRAELEDYASSKGLLDNVGETAGDVAKDVGLGVLQSPRSVVRGATKGVNSMLSFIDDVLDYTPDLTFLSEEGEAGVLPRVTTRGESKEREQKRVDTIRAEKGLEPIEVGGVPQLPVVDKPAKETVTGNLIEGIAQFAVGLKGVDKLGKVANISKASSRAGKLGQSIGKGAAADILAFDQHEERLSNVIQSVPELQNPVTEYLAASEDDGFLEGKVKQGIEGLTLGAAGDVLFDSIKFLKKGKKAKESLELEGGKIQDVIDLPLEDQVGITLDRKKLDVLGDFDSDDLLLKRTKKRADESVSDVEKKLGAAVKETGELKPDELGKRSPEKPDIEINFARIEGPDDIKQLMQDMANDPDLIESVKATRRGVQTDEQLLKGAQDIDGFNELMNRRVGETFNDQQTLAVRKLYYDTTEKLMESAKRAAAAEASDIDQFAFRKMIALHHAVQQEVLGARAEAARALRAWSLPVGAGEGQSIRQIESLVNEFGGIEANRDLARRLAVFGDEATLNTTQINNVVNAGALARTGKALQEAWTLGLLTSPRTHIVNIASNVMTGLSMGMERMSQSVFKDSPVELREGIEYFTAYFGSMREGMANAAEAWKTGQVGIGLGKIDLPPQRSTSREVLDPNGTAGVFSKAVDWYGVALNKYAGGALAAGDEFSKTILYKAQLRSLAFRQARSQGLEGQELKEYVANAMSNPPHSLKGSAIEFANYGTYTNTLTGSGAAVQRAIAKTPIFRFVVPFIRTPLNIFKYTFERTPLGFASQRMREDIAAGGIRKSQALAKIGMGTSVMYMGMDMALNGEITGAGPSDYKVRSKLRNNGWQPYSVKIDDKYYSYARFEPFATWLGMSADMTEIMSNYESYDVAAQDEVDELVTASVAAIANQVVGKTFLQGVSDLTQVLSDSKRFGPQYLKRYAGSFVPALVADIERATTPEVSQVFNMIDAMKARIPGLSKDVPVRRNVYGEVVKSFYPNQDSKLAALGERANAIFNPVYFSDQDKKPNKLDQYFLKNGFSGPNMPAKTQRFEVPGTFGNERVAIDLREYPEIYSRFLEKRGDVTLRQYKNMKMREYLSALVNQDIPESRIFFNPRILDHDKQEKYISNIVADYDSAIREELIEEFPVLRQTIVEEREASRLVNTNVGGEGLIRERAFP